MIKDTAEIRKAFISFFHGKGHQVIDSSSLVPKNDSTLLFTNAGMNQFKEWFLANKPIGYSRVTTCQRCMRAGGKHNDLDQIGSSSRHHTFFEMLGNFSFGDYFKSEAINFAWELLTSSHWFNLPPEKLWITVYETDNETYDIWANQIGIPKEQIIRIGDNKGGIYLSDNFWQMGNTGPCGPCTEIFFDNGEHILGGLPGSDQEDGDRYIEIWNIVFIQYNRQEDGSLLSLVTPSVDTGMGLERIAAVLQHVTNNYEIDIFKKLIELAVQITGIVNNNNNKKSLRIIADHIRSSAFLIADGVRPSNEGRGYVLRHIIRRAVRYGYMLGIKKPFLYKLVTPLIEVMDNYGDLLKIKKLLIEKILETEEANFANTLERGLALLHLELSKLPSDTLDGNTVFRLYDTHGFPKEITAEVCRERNIKIDDKGFNRHMEDQRHRAKKSNQFITNYNKIIITNSTSIFKGNDYYELQATITAIFSNNQLTDKMVNGQDGVIILDNTPFYVESGGQISDTGKLLSKNAEFRVTNTQKLGQAIGHLGKVVQGSLHVGESIRAIINKSRRIKISLNHSATHLLHATLRQVLGHHVEQKGSLVTDKYLRFDFSHITAIPPKQISMIEGIVNTQIRRNLRIVPRIMELETAKKTGAIALFEDKYEKYVRVLTIGDFSVELCNGTHASSTGEIGIFLIIGESNIGTGIRRIEALTGQNALAHINAQNETLNKIYRLIKANDNNVYEKVFALTENKKMLEKHLEKLRTQQAIQISSLLINNVIRIKTVNLLVNKLNNVEIPMLKNIAEIIQSQLGSTVIILATIIDNQVSLIASVTNNLKDIIQANELIKMMAHQISGKGGGRVEFAQACGTNVNALPTALDEIKNFVKNKLLCDHN
ncbi:MAG: alanine--tRNA ligase [Candidatus Dasytiphilus stammeri]